MLNETEKSVEQALKTGQTKDQIFRQLKDKFTPGEVVFHLNNLPTLADRRKYQYVNMALSVVLLLITLKKMYYAASIGAVNMLFFLALIVPAINIYMLKKILKFQRQGYQFLFILSLLSLVHRENHHPFELVMTLLLIAGSGFLYLKMFPKSKRIEES